MILPCGAGERLRTPRMYKSLMTDLLCVSADLPRAVALAARHGFSSVDTSSSLPAAPDFPALLG
ncbi:MAG: hypothetical protein H7Z41_00505 [Cytophagales bacterium]|nr:hypothetical protein [Armatimonadota bacterium]